MKIRFLTVLIVVVLLLGVYFGSPFVVVWDLERAVSAGDPIALSTHIDFPLLRENLKSNLRAELYNGEKDRETSGAEQFTNTLLGLLAGPAVDRMVSPDYLIEMLRGSGPHSEENKSNNEMQTGRMGFESHSRFVVELNFDDSSADSTKSELVFERRGVTDWKVIGVRF